MGGQDVYHRTHGIVYNSNAVYCVVWKPRSSTSVSRLRGFLRTIKLRAPGSPVVLVETCADMGLGGLDVGGLMEEFPEVGWIHPAVLVVPHRH